MDNWTLNSLISFIILLAIFGTVAIVLHTSAIFGIIVYLDVVSVILQITGFIFLLPGIERMQKQMRVEVLKYGLEKSIIGLAKNWFYSLDARIGILFVVFGFCIQLVSILLNATNH